MSAICSETTSLVGENGESVNKMPDKTRDEEGQYKARARPRTQT